MQVRYWQDLPWLISISVMVCQRSIATNQVSSFLRQLKSKTSFDLSPPRAESTDWSRSRENLPSGKRNEVMITYIPHSTISITGRWL